MVTLVAELLLEGPEPAMSYSPNLKISPKGHLGTSGLLRSTGKPQSDRQGVISFHLVFLGYRGGRLNNSSPSFTDSSSMCSTRTFYWFQQGPAQTPQGHVTGSYEPWPCYCSPHTGSPWRIPIQCFPPTDPLESAPQCPSF